ncbi:MAG: DUF6650 family protein [Candidatus Acidiferrum sp.]
MTDEALQQLQPRGSTGYTQKPGDSTPLGGVSWQSSDLEVSAVSRRVIAFLEDRRVLYAPDELEVPSHCVHSILEIRRFLTHSQVARYRARNSLQSICPLFRPDGFRRS